MKRETVQFTYEELMKRLPHINLNPPYQRAGGLWKRDKKQYFIDSLINNFDIPKLYFHYNKSDNYIYHVIDGKQRLETLIEFKDNKFTLDNKSTYTDENSFVENEIEIGSLSYSDLFKEHPNIAYHLINYKFDVVFIYTEDTQNIEEMFRRLNNGAPLTNAEKRYANSNRLNNKIKDLALHPFFTSKVKFNDKRQYHYDTAVRLFYIETFIRNLHPLNDHRLTQFIQNEQYQESVQVNIENVLDMFVRTCNDGDTLLSSRNSFIIYYLVVRNLQVNRIVFNENDYYGFLLQFTGLIAHNRTLPSEEKNQFVTDYDLKNQQGTSGVNSIEFRIEMLLDCFKIYRFNQNHLTLEMINETNLKEDIIEEVTENFEML